MSGGYFGLSLGLFWKLSYGCIQNSSHSFQNLQMGYFGKGKSLFWQGAISDEKSLSVQTVNLTFTFISSVPHHMLSNRPNFDFPSSCLGKTYQKKVSKSSKNWQKSFAVGPLGQDGTSYGRCIGSTFTVLVASEYKFGHTFEKYVSLFFFVIMPLPYETISEARSR